MYTGQMGLHCSPCVAMCYGYTSLTRGRAVTSANRATGRGVRSNERPVARRGLSWHGSRASPLRLNDGRRAGGGGAAPAQLRVSTTHCPPRGRRGRQTATCTRTHTGGNKPAHHKRRLAAALKASTRSRGGPAAPRRKAAPCGRSAPSAGQRARRTRRGCSMFGDVHQGRCEKRWEAAAYCHIAIGWFLSRLIWRPGLVVITPPFFSSPHATRSRSRSSSAKRL